MTLYQNLTGVVSSSSSVLSSTISSVSSSLSTSASVSTSTISSITTTSSSSVSSSLSTSAFVSASTTSSTTTTSSSSLASSSTSSVSSSSSASVIASTSTSSSSVQTSSSQTSSSTSSSTSVQTTSSSQSSITSSSSSPQPSSSSSQTTTSTSSSILSTTTSSSVSSSSSIPPTSTSSLIVSSSSTSSSATPTATSPWAYIGCASDNVLARALTGSFTTDPASMTIEMCQAYCTSKNFGLAGLEYNYECYCGYSLINNSTLGHTGCTYSCPGNTDEICGGSKLLSVYNDTSFVPPSIPQTVGGWNYTGCYTDPVNPRAIASYQVTSTSSMTVEMCVGACEAKGYAFAGVEYGSQCFCGNSISSQSTAVADSQCEVMLCPGNSKEWCSAGSRLQVYSN